MSIDRRQLILPALAFGLLGVAGVSVVPALAASADEEAVAKNVEAFRAAQAVGNAEALAGLCAAELSYSHSSGAVDDKASLLAGVTNAKYKWTSLEYKNPTIRIVGPAAIVRFNFVGEQEFTADGKKVPQNPAHPDELAKTGRGLETSVPIGHRALIEPVRAAKAARSSNLIRRAVAATMRPARDCRWPGERPPARPRVHCETTGLPTH